MKSPELKACSFCKKCESEVQNLVVGLDVYICNECVQLAAEVCDPKLASAASKKKRDLAKQRAVKRLKRILKRNGTVYTIPAQAPGPRVLTVSGGRIIDLSDSICDLFAADEGQAGTVEDLAGVLFGSRRAIKRLRL